MIDEVWKDVVGFENFFEVSSYGRVKSKRTHKILKQTKLKSGYSTITTRIGGRSGKCYCFRVHRLVAEVFLEKPSEELIEICSKQHYGKVLVCHKDNNKENNHFSNLKWGSSQDNTNDYMMTEEFKENVYNNSGAGNFLSKLSSEDVEYIRLNFKPYDKMFGARALGRKFNLAHSNILRVVRNKSYCAELV